MLDHLLAASDTVCSVISSVISGAKNIHRQSRQQEHSSISWPNIRRFRKGHKLKSTRLYNQTGPYDCPSTTTGNPEGCLSLRLYIERWCVWDRLSHFVYRTQRSKTTIIMDILFRKVSLKPHDAFTCSFTLVKRLIVFLRGNDFSEYLVLFVRR